MDKNRFIAYKALLSFERNQREIKYILNNELEGKNIESKDLRLISEIVYGSTRQRLNLDWRIKKFFKGNFNDIDIELLVLLRVGVYQIFFCSNIPDHAAVDSSVEIAKKIKKKYTTISNGILRNIIRNKDKFTIKDISSVKMLSFLYSHPEWLIKKWLKEWGKEDVVDLMKSNNNRPDIWFRIKSNELSNPKLKQFLKDQVKKTNSYLKNYYKFKNTQLILKSIFFKNGLISVQNPTSGIFVDLLDIGKKDSILDACAAPGGKSKYIYEKMTTKNKLTCLEINTHRYKILKENLKHINNNLNIFNVDFLKFKSQQLFDKILLDVPCIGTGVMSKRSDLRWLKKPTDINKNKIILLKMLKKASKLIKRDGVIVYSTCSIEKEDSSSIVNEFIRTNDEFIIDRSKKYCNDNFIQKDGSVYILPQKHNIDGGYAARIIKK